MENKLSENLDINVAFGAYIDNPTAENYELIFAASNRLIEKFVYSTANKQKAREDLVQSGYLGLTKAIKSYKKDIGTKFSTWASTCIISEIRHEVRKEQKFFNVGNNFDEEDSFSGLISLTSADGKSMIEEKPDSKAENATNLHMDLKLILESLSELDRQIVDLLFFKDMSQDEVAKQLNISQKKVSRQKAKIVSLMQTEMLGAPVDFKLVDNKKSFVRQASPLDNGSFELVKGKSNKEIKTDDDFSDFKIISKEESFKLVK